ncbi:Putative protein of unknown function [Podospora comata]|uniref:Uncharacterized protein n=1 Tax=Podospora comata TaxID=48703 RepID=A0ABY6S0R4_PODCO|nr:Putative protein of unknown function [Podospora comata]
MGGYGCWDSSPTSQANNTTTITTKCPHRTSNVNALTSKVPIAQTRHPRSSLCPQSIHHTNKATQFSQPEAKKKKATAERAYLPRPKGVGDGG